MNTQAPAHSIAPIQPSNSINGSINPSTWVDWLWTAFLPAWVERAHDPQGFGFYDRLDDNAQPVQDNRRTVLSQARLLFTFSHLALNSNNPIFYDAAAVCHDALPRFQNETGGYRRARSANGAATDNAEDSFSYSYDQSFVILGLVTWARLDLGDSSEIEKTIDACWHNIENTLTDPVTGLLLEHDGLDDPANPCAPPRAQNPHMHLYEAALQAYEMTLNPVWLKRASRMRGKGLDYFFDKDTGTIIEFLAPNLSPLLGKEGERREVGHQCEWAWLLYREAELSGDQSVIATADALLAFADSHGFAKSGVMQGAAFDAVSCDASWRENTFLLWPQTEAIKTYAIRAANPHHAQHAQDLTELVFQQYFANYAGFVNQLDDTGTPVWPEALSRLLYHLVLALTEGGRAGLWQMPE